MLKTIVKKGSYHDSVVLMLLTNQISALEGVKKASIMMATPANKDIFKQSGLDTQELMEATANDMVVVADVEDDSLLDQIMETLGDEKIYGIGIGAIGPVDKNRGKILAPPNFYGLHDLEIAREIEEHCHMPVFFDGESNCAAIMEKYYGAGTDCEDFIYVDLANGVGSGLVVNGELYANTSGMICELGHTSIDWQGEPCSCGNRGCLERYISSNVLESQLQKVTGDMKDFRGFCQEMDEAIKEGEGNTFTKRQQDMDRVFTEMTEKLSCALVGFVNSLNPQKIIIGHEGYWIPDPYLCKIEKLVNERHIERKYRQIQVVKSGFKDEATVYGCTGALLTAVFEGSFFD